MTKLPVLNVSLHREVIGTLTYIGADRSLFALSASYIDNPTRPTLSLSFKDALGELITTCKPTQTKLLHGDKKNIIWHSQFIYQHY